MVFPHGQSSRKKKYKIGYRDKKGNSYADDQKDVAAAGEDVGETEMIPTLPFQSHNLLLVIVLENNYAITAVIA